MSRNVQQATIYLAAVIVGVFMMLPFLWMLSTSLKTGGALTALPIQWIPSPPTLEPYREIFRIFPFGRAIANSLFVAAGTVTITMVPAAMAAFVFARMRFRGRTVLFFLVLGTLMVPRQVTIIPLFIVLRSLGLINTFTGLLAPSIFHAFAIFMLRQHMLRIPSDYLDAAVIDGASTWRIFSSVIMPMSVTIVVTLGVLIFMEAWNDYFWPLVVLTEESKMTLNVALTRIQGQYATRYNLLMAGSLLSTLPMLIIYAVAQRFFRAGLHVGGLKG
ncbi:MAG: carbohydrate ABC transporter permease [Spirochaetia bacterium]